MKCSSLVLILTSHVKFQVYSRLKLTQRCSSPAGLVSNLNLLKFLSWNKQPHYLLRAVPWINAPSPLFRGARVTQWWDRLPPTNVARVQLLARRVDAICGLSLLLVFSLASRGFSPGTLVFPSSQKLTLPNSNSIWNTRTHLNKFIWTPMCFMGKQAIYNFF